ncbi:hypothetical protein D3C79_652190 [compost metagenome]
MPRHRGACPRDRRAQQRRRGRAKLDSGASHHRRQLPDPGRCAGRLPPLPRSCHQGAEPARPEPALDAGKAAPWRHSLHRRHRRHHQLPAAGIRSADACLRSGQAGRGAGGAPCQGRRADDPARRQRDQAQRDHPRHCRRTGSCLHGRHLRRRAHRRVRRDHGRAAGVCLLRTALHHRPCPCLWPAYRLVPPLRARGRPTAASQGDGQSHPTAAGCLRR